MKRYAFLVRGINVGGRHKVVMEEFCRELEELGMSHVSSYINSGNLFFDSEGNTAKMYGFDSVYTVNGSTVSFDFFKSAKAWSTLTVKTYIDWQITMENKYIAELEELAKKEQDATKKKKYVCVISSDRQSIKR